MTEAEMAEKMAREAMVQIPRAEYEALKKVLSAASFALEDLDAFLVGELGHEWSEHYGGTYEILEDLRTALDAAKGRKR